VSSGVANVGAVVCNELLDVVDCFIVVADVVVEAVVAASGVDVVVDDVVVGCVGDSGALVEKAVSGVCV
jgi:hypothetical protein